MRYIHTIIIEQLPNGDTLLTHRSKTIGRGQPSAQTSWAVQAFYDAFADFFNQYKPGARANTTAVLGRAEAIESVPDIQFDWESGAIALKE